MTTHRVPDHVTTPLITLITQQALDSDYETVAARRATNATPARSRHTLSALGAVVFGLLVAIAAVQTSRNADANELSREGLVARVQEAKRQATKLQVQVGELQAQRSAAEDNLARIAQRENEATRAARRLEARTGFAAVQGPGVRVTVDDAPGGNAQQVVQDDDLALLVDGLWAAGAEAISINGQRLTVMSSIQNSGVAIHVNDRPLAPPYQVLAIGSPERLQSQLIQTTQGARWYSLAQSLDFVFTMKDDDDLQLPAAPWVRLRYAGTQLKAEGFQQEDAP